MTTLTNTAQFLSVKDTAKLFGLSEMTIRRHIKAGGIEALRFGRTVRIPTESLERYVAERPRTSAVTGETR